MASPFQQQSRTRKLIYLGVIIGLFSGSWVWRKADFTVRLDHEAINPTTPFVRGNKVAVFDKDQDLVYTNSTRLLSGAVKGACEAMVKPKKGA